MKEKDITICGHGSGTPSLKNMEEYLSMRYSLKANNGVRKGLVAVRRLKKITDGDRNVFVEAYKSILGRNKYSQSLREYVFTPYKDGKYYSDCSSSGDACYMAAGHDVGWLNTAGQYESSKFEDVPVNIEEGHVTNPEVLKVGDALLFAGNDPSRPKQIGHVEYVYSILSWRWVKSDGKWYYQDASGANTYGWKRIKETAGDAEHWYYFDQKGAAMTGLITVDGENYYMQESGKLECALCETDDTGALRPWYIYK